jgi:hypothetical protein
MWPNKPTPSATCRHFWSTMAHYDHKTFPSNPFISNKKFQTHTPPSIEYYHYYKQTEDHKHQPRQEAIRLVALMRGGWSWLEEGIVRKGMDSISLLTCDKKIELPGSTEGVLFLKGWKIELPATLGLWRGSGRCPDGLEGIDASHLYKRGVGWNLFNLSFHSYLGSTSSRPRPYTGMILSWGQPALHMGHVGFNVCWSSHLDKHTQLPNLR